MSKIALYVRSPHYYDYELETELRYHTYSLSILHINEINGYCTEITVQDFEQDISLIRLCPQGLIWYEDVNKHRLFLATNDYSIYVYN